MTGIVIHVGLSKTATTTLQRAVFENHSQIHYLGKIYKSEHKRQCLSPDTHDFLEPLLWKVDVPWDAEAAKAFYAGTLEPRALGKVILGSWEGLGQQSPTSFETSVTRLAAACGNSRVLISLRNPLSRLPSMYLQHLRGNQKQLADKYVSFEEWLDSYAEQHGNLASSFTYRDNIEAARRSLGPENVGVFLYEDFQSDPEAYLEGVSSFLGIDAGETIALADNQHLHRRLSAAQADRMKDINSSFLGRLAWRSFGSAKRKELIGFTDESDAAHQAGASVELRPDVMQRISDAARESNQWLVTHLQLDLDKRGYPL